MAELFWSYWDASARFGMLAAVLLALSPLLKRWVSPNILCWAWGLLLLRLALPMALPFSGSIFNLSKSLQPSTWTEALRSGVVDAGWGETILPNLKTEEDMVIATLVGFSWQNALLLVWLSGIAILLLGLLVNAIRLRRFFARATRHSSGRLYEIFKDTRRRFGIHANVPLLVSKDVKTPGIAGIFNPRIVLPQVCADELSDSEIRCVLLHELTHYRRGDLFTHHLLLLVCFLHWYNPLVWLVFRAYKNAMEQACDADVVDSDCVETVQQYGFTLLQVMRRSRLSFASPAGALCLLGNRRNSALRERIQLIATPQRHNPLLLGAGLALFGASFVFAITGEEAVEREASRLLSLTRFSTPAASSSQQQQQADEERRDRVEYLAFETMVVSAPRTWLQDVDAREYRGQAVRVRVSYHVDLGSEQQSFWINALNAQGAVVASARASNGRSVKREELVFETWIRVPQDAAQMVYGLSASGAASIWVDRIAFLPEGPR